MVVSNRSRRSGSEGASTTSERGLKDQVLDQVAETANVAQFVSFGTGPEFSLRYVRIRGEEGTRFSRPEEAIERLFRATPSGTVNVRSFHPDRPKGGHFIYALHKVQDAISAVRRLAAAGAYTIVNETIDVADGGVSGVVMGKVAEFAPEDTPRCVEKPGTVSLEIKSAMEMLGRVYGFEPELDFPPEKRVEFSVHPLRQGLRQRHTIVWEIEETEKLSLSSNLHWPNRFSRFIGDKAFGLLLASVFGFPVPRTTVLSRRISPFAFGDSTGTGEYWIRTCPVVQTPGKYTTRRGWIDPFELLSREDPKGESLASVLAQEGVDAVFSGAFVKRLNGNLQIEGVRGSGESFMLGTKSPDRLTRRAVRAAEALSRAAEKRVGGAVRMEWVFDGTKAWVIQMHQGRVPGDENTIYPGRPERFVRFVVEDGIENLRVLIASIQGTNTGVAVVGEVGITSHIGDLLRQARVPSYLAHIPNS